ncbi:amidohydrolase [Devosia ginsengisoli]|uniref:amidohydrolase family protein n=1 Tax=Devosia ginsengisoli TaxID=400770 RepID=UPI0026F1A2AA|nr:amidohydrolase family protein [Devosia ginsengisoli]MCR6670756.1 amidohydrolase [Devosia ginsengisoli]
MIIDGHCHVWENWPYQPAVPDPTSRARAEQLLFEMDSAGVEQAIIICASLAANPRNADYAFAMTAAYPGRFTVFPDLECKWSPNFRKPDAALRLETALRRWDFKGFTLYLADEESGDWLTSDDGTAFFALAERAGLIASLSAMPHQMPAVIALARRFPSLRIILHHFGFLGPRSATDLTTAEPVLAAAACPNIWMKYSGMGNVAAAEQEFPYSELRWIPEAVGAAFGPSRLIWGSDWPVSRRHMTYGQALSLLRRHGPFNDDEIVAVLGGNLERLLGS